MLWTSTLDALTYGAGAAIGTSIELGKPKLLRQELNNQQHIVNSRLSAVFH